MVANVLVCYGCSQSVLFVCNFCAIKAQRGSTGKCGNTVDKPGKRRRSPPWSTNCTMPKTAWFDAREAARAKIKRDVEFRAVGYDIDPQAVEIARENAKKAGVSEKISVLQADIRDFQASPEQLIVCNPPYGERLLDVEAARALYKTMGTVFPKENAVSVISPDQTFEQCFGRKAVKRRKLYNGMLQCNLYQYWK